MRFFTGQDQQHRRPGTQKDPVGHVGQFQAQVAACQQVASAVTGLCQAPLPISAEQAVGFGVRGLGSGRDPGPWRAGVQRTLAEAAGLLAFVL